MVTDTRRIAPGRIIKYNGSACWLDDSSKRMITGDQLFLLLTHGNAVSSVLIDGRVHSITHDMLTLMRIVA